MDGYLFGFLRRHALEESKEQARALESVTAQRDALLEVIKVLVPERDVRQSYVDPLYHRMLRKELLKRGLPVPLWVKS